MTIIAATGEVLAKKIENAKNCGCSDVLFKPLKKDKIKNLIIKYCEQQKN